MTFSRERTHQEQKKDGMLTNIITAKYFSFTTSLEIRCSRENKLVEQLGLVLFHNSAWIYYIITLFNDHIF